MSQLTQVPPQTQQQVTSSSLIKSNLLQRVAITPVHRSVLQRCSNGVECPECRQKRLEREGTLQRAAIDSASSNGAPPIAHDVLSSPGQPLDAGTRAFMEPRFGYDFSGVRVYTTAPELIQTKLTINRPGDKYEQEADQMAEQVMRMPRPEVSLESGLSKHARDIHIQRLCSTCEEEVQRQIDEEEEDEALQAKELPSQTPQLSPELQSRINSIKGKGQSIPESTRAFMETRFGYDFSRVRIHTDSNAAELAQAVNARAFALGHDIVFGNSAYAPETTAGKKLLAHELTHVVQQREASSHQNRSVTATSDNFPTSPNAHLATLSSAGSIQRVPLIDGIKSATQFSTPAGNFYRFSTVPHHKNQQNRPKFVVSTEQTVPYSGEGSKGTGKTACSANKKHYRINRVSAFKSALDKLMLDMHQAGKELDDESLKSAIVHNAFRPKGKGEGGRFLSALIKTTESPRFKDLKLTFPSDVKNMAQSELGSPQFPNYQALINALAQAPGWTKELAEEAVNTTRDVKAPSGGSTHHSGVTVDINFAYTVDGSNVTCHGTDRDNNHDALRSAAGVWLNMHAHEYGFDTYNTAKEIWHQEWLEWSSTDANPDQKQEPTAPKPKQPTVPKPKKQKSVGGEKTVPKPKEQESAGGEKTVPKPKEQESAGGEKTSQEATSVEQAAAGTQSKQGCALTTFTASNFIGKKVTADVEFLDALKAINAHAVAADVKLDITDSFRPEGKKVSGAIVTPAKQSNHLAGHAIDMNVMYGPKYNHRCNSKCLGGNPPPEVSAFTKAIQENKALRWGGNFSKRDPVHIDDHLNKNEAKWQERYIATQEARNSGCG